MNQNFFKTPQRLDKILSNFGYCSRLNIKKFLSKNIILHKKDWNVYQTLEEKDKRSLKILNIDEKMLCSDIILNGKSLESLQPLEFLTLLLYKPKGIVCTSDVKSEFPTVYSLLPPSLTQRKFGLSICGRLDQWVTGMVLLSEDGLLASRIISPKKKVFKHYAVTLQFPLQGHETAIFESGELLLRNEEKPCLPAKLSMTSATNLHQCIIQIQEGKYHQVRRMFAAVGNHVTEMERIQIGSLPLPASLKQKEYQILNANDISKLFI